MRKWWTLCSYALLTSVPLGCGEDPLQDGDDASCGSADRVAPSTLELVIEGEPIDCALPAVVHVTESRPRVTVRTPGPLQHAGVDVSIADASVHANVLRSCPDQAQIELESLETGLTRLQVSAPAEAGMVSCDVFLSYEPARDELAADLRRSSTSPAAIVWSRRSTTPSLIRGTFRLDGDAVDERARAFVTRFAPLLGIAGPDDLVLQSTRDAEAGLQVLRFTQVAGAHAIDGGTLILTFDASGALRVVNNDLVPEARRETTPIAAPDDVALLADITLADGTSIGAVATPTPVLWDEMHHFRAGEPGARWGWRVPIGGVGGVDALLVDDERMEVVGSIRRSAGAAMEGYQVPAGFIPGASRHESMYTPQPNHLVWTGQSTDSTLTPVDATLADAFHQHLFTETAAAAEFYREEFVRDGWCAVDNLNNPIPNAPVPPVRVTDTTSINTASRYFVNWTMMLARACPNCTWPRGNPSRDIACHEYSHGVFFCHFAIGGNDSDALAEALPDVMAVQCEDSTSTGGSRWLIGETDVYPSDPTRAYRDLAAPAAGGPGNVQGDHAAHYSDYDRNKDNYFRSTIISHAAYRIVEEEGLSLQKNGRLFYHVGVNDTTDQSTLPEFRNAAVAKAKLFADTGVASFTDQDACRVARGFRSVGLDRVNPSSSTGGTGGNNPLDCTTDHCPLCDCINGVEDEHEDGIDCGPTCETECPDEPTSTGSSGSDTSGGDTSGGDTSGGDTSGGNPSGGDPSGGDPSGGDPSGGDPSGGDPSGGDPSGGDPSGGDPSGGDPSGGDPSGGDDSPGCIPSGCNGQCGTVDDGCGGTIDCGSCGQAVPAIASFGYCTVVAGAEPTLCTFWPTGSGLCTGYTCPAGTTACSGVEGGHYEWCGTTSRGLIGPYMCCPPGVTAPPGADPTPPPVTCPPGFTNAGGPSDPHCVANP